LLNTGLAIFCSILFAQPGFRAENPGSSSRDGPPIVPVFSIPLPTQWTFIDLSPAPADVRISRFHNVALCREIGERLGISMGQKPVGLPPRLMILVKRLHDENSKSSQAPEAFR
jgi:hypothetical protein